MAKAKVVPLTDASYEAAVEAGREAQSAPTAVLRAWVQPLPVGPSFGLSVELRSGAIVTIPINLIPELATKPVEKLAKVKVDGFGEGLLWPSIDVAISAPGLLEKFFGYATRAKIARAGGRARTPKKVAAARKNGRKGGRPKQRATPRAKASARDS